MTRASLWTLSRSAALHLIFCKSSGQGRRNHRDAAPSQAPSALQVPWQTGGMFTTPPGWWHSHHNESSEDAWVVPFQDAGLLTFQVSCLLTSLAPPAPSLLLLKFSAPLCLLLCLQRILNIRFASEEAAALRKHKERGATVEGQNVKI